MRLIYRPRQCGKTTELVKYAVDHDYYVLALNQSIRLSLLKRFPDLKPSQVILASQAENLRGCSGGVCIDHAEHILALLLGIKFDQIKAMVMDSSLTRECSGHD